MRRVRYVPAFQRRRNRAQDTSRTSISLTSLAASTWSAGESMVAAAPPTPLKARCTRRAWPRGREDDGFAGKDGHARCPQTARRG